MNIEKIRNLTITIEEISPSSMSKGWYWFDLQMTVHFDFPLPPRKIATKIEIPFGNLITESIFDIVMKNIAEKIKEFLKCPVKVD